MRRLEYHRYGPPSVLRLAECPTPEPARGEVTVRVAAAAVNALDWKMRRGQMRWVTGWRFPRGIGQDFAGEVEAVGPGVDQFKVGDPVFGSAGWAAGAFAECVVVAAGHLARKPPEVSFEQAAALPIVGVTALQVLDKAGIGPGHAVFVNGAAGGVGRAAVQLARDRGAAVGGSVRDPSAEPLAAALSPAVGFDFLPAAFEQAFDLVFDTVGVLVPREACRMVRRGGSVVNIVPTLGTMFASLRYRAYRLQMGSRGNADLAAVGRAAAVGTLHIPVAKTVPLDQAIDALTELEEHGRPKGGKLVILP